MEEHLPENEHIELIDGRLQLIVSPAHSFGTDALLLAAFASPGKNDRVCDLGAGCGILPFYWFAKGLSAACAVELQPAACDQLRRSARLSGVEDRLTVEECDLNDLRGRLPFGAFDLVTMNPPYFKEGTGAKSADPSRRLARHETSATLPEIAAAAENLLKFGGRFCLCQRPERLSETFCAMEARHLTPKRLRFVAQENGKAPWLFLLECKKGRHAGLKVETEFHMQNDDGSLSDAWRQVLGPYGKD